MFLKIATIIGQPKGLRKPLAVFQFADSSKISYSPSKPLTEDLWIQKTFSKNLISIMISVYFFINHLLSTIDSPKDH